MDNFLRKTKFEALNCLQMAISMIDNLLLAIFNGL